MQYTIKVKSRTKERLKSLGSKDQTYDDVVNDILDRQEYGENQ